MLTRPKRWYLLIAQE